MNFIKLLLIFFITFYSSKKVYGQIEYFYKSHNIYLEGSNIIEEIIIEGKITDNDGTQISIPYTSLEKITDLKLEWFDKKVKNIKQKEFLETSLTSRNFYDGVKSLQYYIPKPTTFKLKYRITRDDLMYVSTLNFYTYYKCDSITYEISIPKDKYVFYNLPYHIENLKIDSSETEIGKKYKFHQSEKSQTAIVDLKTNKSSYLFSNYKSQVVRIQISDNDNPQKSLNDWYYKLVESTGELNDNSKHEIDSLLRDVNDNESVEKKLLKFVQEKIRYLAIEDGVNAFVPRNVNDILSNRQGDCKDMSNLLVKALMYRGIEANMALSSSLSHRLELNFPNIASANHVVCVVKKNDGWMLFDATDKYCEYSNPSIHTQGRNIFIINKEEGVFYQIEKIDYRFNTDSTYSELKLNNNRLVGKIMMNKNGLSNRKVIALNYYNKEDLNNNLKKLIAKKYDSYNIDSLKHSITSLNSVLECNVEQRTSSVTKVKDRNYLPVKHLIGKVHPFPKVINKNERIITYEAINKKHKIILELDLDFTLLKQLNTFFKKGPFSFTFKVEKKSDKFLMIDYEMIIKEVEIKGEDKKGLDIAKIIRQNNPYAIIAFVTTHIEFMPQAFGVT
ncbi:MAG: hypothetical protein COB15_13250, partial [Flavobacteriales bacterium]